MCGHQTVSWHDMVGALFCPPEGQFFTISRPIRQETLDHWRPMFNLWLHMPRGRVREGTQWTFHGAAGRAAREVTATTRELWLFFVITSTVLCTGFLCAYLLVTTSVQTYMEWTKSQMSMPWAVVTLGYIPICSNIVLLWKKIVLGLEQTWIQATKSTAPDSSSSMGRVAIIEAIRGALTTRDCTDVHDKCISLYGILDACGIEHPPPDYSVAVGETYQRFLEHLIHHWDSRALLLLLDCGERCPSDGQSWLFSSWVPNWTLGAGPSAWLTSQYHTRPMERSTYPRGPQIALPRQPDRDILVLEGISLGKITYHATVSPTSDASGQARSSTSDITTLVGYIAHAFCAIRASRRAEMADHPESAISAVLEGLIRDTRSTWKEITGPNGTRSMTRAPISEAPYDFRNERWLFSKFRSVCSWIMAQQDSWIARESESTEGGASPAIMASGVLNVADSGAVEADVKKADGGGQPLRPTSASSHLKPSHLSYLETVSEKLLTQERGLFVMSSDYHGNHLGSGPLCTKVGDEVFLLKCIPCPMVLRRVAGLENEGRKNSAGSGKWKIIGAAFVEGRMHVPSYVGEYGEVTIC